MAKYKDEDAIIKALHNHFFITDVSGADWFDQIMNQVVDEIKNVPAADVVEAVRCHDCIYHTEDDECTNGRWDNWSNSDYELYPEALEMDYCSYGVRKDG